MGGLGTVFCVPSYGRADLLSTGLWQPGAVRESIMGTYLLGFPLTAVPFWFGKTQIAVGVFYTVFAIVLAAVFRPYEDRRANGYYVGSLVRDSAICSTPV